MFILRRFIHRIIHLPVYLDGFNSQSSVSFVIGPFTGLISGSSFKILVVCIFLES